MYTAQRNNVTSQPIDVAQRVAELDVLRGMALFGVFLLNMVGLAEAEVMASSAQLEALPTAHLDHIVLQLIQWLLLDKANTLFAFLFGLGFYLQMERLDARGADAVRIYRRRLTILLCFGIVHILFIWTWEILHLYALAGFALLALRKLRTRTLLLIGLPLALFGRVVQDSLAEFAGFNDWHGYESPYSDEAALIRQGLSAAGDYSALVREFIYLGYVDYILNAAIIGWLMYALGRFMIGAWVGRHGWLQRAADYLPGYRRLLWLTLPVGLIIGAVAGMISILDDAERLPPWDHWLFLGRSLHLIAVPLLATGYLCAIVVTLHTERGHRLLSPFAYAGRMALSNYVAQSFFFGFILFGVGPGLNLAGHIGSAKLLFIVTVAYAVQVVVSRWWLSRFRYGPLEWVWRGLTYGQWPVFRLTDQN